MMVDQSGRIIPEEGMLGVVASNGQFYIREPLDLSTLYRQVTKYFPVGTVFVSEKEFKKRAKKLRAEIARDRQMKNLLRGWYLPIPLPQMRDGDYGQVLGQDYLPLVDRAYRDRFPRRSLHNWIKNDLTEKVAIADERHGRLVQRMVDCPTVGLYFANPFHGFGIQAARTMIETFPGGYSLSGGFDAAVAHIAAPQIMARDVNTPATDCAAVNWRGASYSLNFDSCAEYLYFGIRLPGPFKNCSSGLLFSG